MGRFRSALAAAGLAAHPPALSLAETSELLSKSMDRSLEILHRPRGQFEQPDPVPVGCLRR